MCVLCGYGLSPFDWAEVPLTDLSPEAASASHREFRRDRDARIRVCNAVLSAYGVSVHSAMGRGYLLRDRKGRSAIAYSVNEVWNHADMLADRPPDPLDPELLRQLEQ